MTTDAVPASPSTDKDATAPVDGVKQECQQKRVIVIDPGHGGEHDLDGSSANNATAVSGVLEKTLTLEWAKVLKTQLESADVKAIFTAKGYCEVKVILTRESDVNLSAVDRVAVATTNKADILMSIHFNGFDKVTRGVETYYKAKTNVAQSNEAEDKELATLVNTALYNAIKALDSKTKNRNIKPDTQTEHKSLGVLRDPGIGLSGAMCRSILSEIEFITVAAVDTLLVSGPNVASNRQAILLEVAKALARAL
jgi:N-acetylmuramoyl-L-alanine amidase